MKPKIFIGSSVEARKIAHSIQEILEFDADCTVWTQGVFQLSSTALHDLIKKSSEVDFAIFVFNPDDITLMRNNANSTVRDNVIFETGLFIGKIGIERVYFIVPSDSDEIHLPTDLLGITPGRYDKTRNDLTAALGPCCNKIRRQIEELGHIKTEVAVNREPAVANLEYTEKHRELDRSVCIEIKNMLPINGSIRFIRDYNFAGFPYERSLLDDLKNYHYTGDNVTLEFVNPELEEIRVKLSDRIAKLIHVLAFNTWVSDSNSEFSSVPPEWEDEQPERFEKVVGDIHNTAEEVCETYDLLIKKAKIILAV